jgi:hypothetical protein
MNPRQQKLIKTADARLEVAYARGRAIRIKLQEAEGGSLPASAAAVRMGISRSTLIRWYHHGKLIGWKRGHAIRVPIWQFKEGRLLPGLDEVLKTASSGRVLLNDDGRMLFFLSNLSSLNGRRPLDLLREGDVESVKKAVLNQLWL